MRFSERSRICLMPRRGKDKSKIFSFRPLPSKIASDFRRQRSVSSDSGSPQIPLESEGTAVLPIRVFFSRFFHRAIYGSAKNLSHKWLGKKNLRHAPANPFMRFARRAVNRKERQDFIPSAPQGQRKKTRESEGTRRLPSKIASDFRRQARALFTTFPLIPPFPPGTRYASVPGENRCFVRFRWEGKIEDRSLFVP